MSLSLEAFPALSRKIDGYPLIYFDSAATALKPTCVIDAVSNFDRQLGASVHRGVYRLAEEATALYQDARKKVQNFLSAEHFEEILFTRGTTASLNLLAMSFAKTFCKKGDVILLSEIEHHSNLIPWQMVAKTYDLELQYIPVNDNGELILDAPFDSRVKLVSIAHVSNVLGTLHPIEKIVSKAKEVGAKVALDGAQSAPHLPIDVKRLDIDFFAFSGHKLYGPTGIGVLYGRRELLEQMEPVFGGGDMVEMATLDGFTAAPLPYKFEAGTPPISAAVGLGAAIDFLEALTMEKVAEHGHKLLTDATQKLGKLDRVKLLGTASDKGPIISFIVEGVHPLDLISLLDCRGIAMRTGHHCSQNTMSRFNLTSTCRISFGLYNSIEEIDQFIAHLTEGLTLL